MKVVLDAVFLKKLRKTDVRIRNSTKERILLFSKDPRNLELNNHPLKDKYLGFQSIDITNDWRAIYHEVKIEGETVAYFIILGTHEELYGAA